MPVSAHTKGTLENRMNVEVTTLQCKWTERGKYGAHPKRGLAVYTVVKSYARTGPDFIRAVRTSLSQGQQETGHLPALRYWLTWTKGVPYDNWFLGCLKSAT